ncbi:uncharacterized protein LOC111642365 [Centruroides sculpturatus]|uniref:uncharacterized protein LOC111642365 n=1 Tax=Centruroides sculpturatus TaxID=218467 RepID=UPI000C6E754A|nr:uncharacterized protein LOC111642365 [Centruroides sculpturatus]
MPSVIAKSFQVCESLGVGHSEGEGRTLRHHPHFTTPTRIAERNAPLFMKGVKQSKNNYENLQRLGNKNMKCHRINEPHLDVAINNRSDDQVKKSEIKATEETHEKIVKYEGNRRIKRKIIKTTEFSHIKTKCTNAEKLDGFLNGNRNEELKKNELCDWLKLNGFKTQRDKATEYDYNQSKLSKKSDKKYLHHKNRVNEREKSTFYKKDSSREVSQDEMIRTYSSESTEYETSQDELMKTNSTESIVNDTSSSYEYDRLNNSDHIQKVNVSYSKTSMNSPPISIKKEQWPDIKCKMRVLSTKDKPSVIPTNIVYRKNLENGDNRDYSSSELEWETTHDEKPIATFKIRQNKKYTSLEEQEYINGSKSITIDKNSAREKPPSPTVMFRIKTPTKSDKYQYHNTINNTTSDETSTLSSVSVHSIDHFVAESTTNTLTDYIREDRLSYQTPSKQRYEYKENLIEKDSSSENFSTHSSKEEEIKYQNKPIEILFRIKSYDEENTTNKKNTEKIIDKTYSKQFSDIKSPSTDSNCSVESEHTHSNRTYNQFTSDSKVNDKNFSFPNKKDNYSAFKKDKTFEAFRGTSEIVHRISKPVKSYGTNTQTFDEKSKSDSSIMKIFSYNSQKFVPKVEKPKYQDYSQNISIRKFEKENKMTRNEDVEEIKHEIISNKYENSLFSNNKVSDRIPGSDPSKKEWNQNNYVRTIKDNNLSDSHNNYPEQSHFVVRKPARISSEFKNNETFEEKKASNDINKYVEIKHYRSDFLKEKSIGNDNLRHSPNIDTIQSDVKYASQSFHVKCNTPYQKRKEKEDDIQIQKCVNFDDLKTETLILNKYFDTKSEKTNSENHPKEKRSFDDVYAFSRNYTNLKISENQSHSNSNKMSQLLRVEIPPHCKPSNTKKEPNVNLQEVDKRPDICNKKIYEEIKLNSLETNTEIDYRKINLKYFPNDRDKTNEKTSSLFNNIKWHSVNREKNEEFSSDFHNKSLSTEILTKKSIFTDDDIEKIDRLKDFRRNKLKCQSFKTENHIRNVENSRDENEFYSRLDAIKQLERISEENRKFKEDIEKINSNHKHLSGVSIRPDISRIIQNEKFYNEVIEKTSKNYPGLNRQLFNSRSQDLKTENKGSKIDDKTVKETYTVQVQLSHKGFRIKNWKEEVIIHRMLFTSFKYCDKPAYDVTKSKNVISEKRFYIDAANRYKFTKSENSKRENTSISNNSENNYIRDIFSMRNNGYLFNIRADNTSKRATSLYVVWIPDFYKTSTFDENSIVDPPKVTNFLSTLHNCFKDVDTVCDKRPVWPPLLQEYKYSAVSALLKSEWSTGGCSMSHEESVPITRVKPLTSFNLSCTENSTTNSQKLSPTVISSITIPFTVRSAQIKERSSGFLMPRNMFQNSHQFQQNLPNICHHRQVSFSESSLISHKEKPTVLRALYVRTDNCSLNDCIVIRNAFNVPPQRTAQISLTSHPNLRSTTDQLKVFQSVCQQAISISENITAWFILKKNVIPNYEIVSYFHQLVLTNINCEYPLSIVLPTLNKIVELNGQYVSNALEYSINSIKLQTSIYFPYLIISEQEYSPTEQKEESYLIAKISRVFLFGPEKNFKSVIRTQRTCLRNEENSKFRSTEMRNNFENFLPFSKPKNLVIQNLQDYEATYRCHSISKEDRRQDLIPCEKLGLISSADSLVAKYSYKTPSNQNNAIKVSCRQLDKPSQDSNIYSPKVAKYTDLYYNKHFLNYIFVDGIKSKELLIPRLLLIKPKIKFHKNIRFCNLLFYPTIENSLILFNKPQNENCVCSCKHILEYPIVMNINFVEFPLNINVSSRSEELIPKLNARLYDFQEYSNHLIIQDNCESEMTVTCFNRVKPFLQMPKDTETYFNDYITKERSIAYESISVFTASSVNKINIKCKIEKSDHLQIQNIKCSYPMKVLTDRILDEKRMFSFEPNNCKESHSLFSANDLFNTKFNITEKKAERKFVSLNFNANFARKSITDYKNSVKSQFHLPVSHHSSIQTVKTFRPLKIFYFSSGPEQLLSTRIFETSLLNYINKSYYFCDQCVNMFSSFSSKEIISNVKLECDLLQYIYKYIPYVDNSLRKFLNPPLRAEKLSSQVDLSYELNVSNNISFGSVKSFPGQRLRKRFLNMTCEDTLQQHIFTKCLFENNSLSVFKLPLCKKQFPRYESILSEHVFKKSILHENNIKIIYIFPFSTKKIEKISIKREHQPICKCVTYLQDTLPTFILVTSQAAECHYEFHTEQGLCNFFVDASYALKNFKSILPKETKLLPYFEKSHQIISVIIFSVNESVKVFNILLSPYKSVNCAFETNLLQAICSKVMHLEEDVKIFSASSLQQAKLEIKYEDIDIPIKHINIHSIPVNYSLIYFITSRRIRGRSHLIFETKFLQEIKKCQLFFENSLNISESSAPLLAEKIDVFSETDFLQPLCINNVYLYDNIKILSIPETSQKQANYTLLLNKYVCNDFIRVYDSVNTFDVSSSMFLKAVRNNELRVLENTFKTFSSINYAQLVFNVKPVQKIQFVKNKKQNEPQDIELYNCGNLCFNRNSMKELLLEVKFQSSLLNCACLNCISNHTSLQVVSSFMSYPQFTAECKFDHLSYIDNYRAVINYPIDIFVVPNYLIEQSKYTLIPGLKQGLYVSEKNEYMSIKFKCNLHNLITYHAKRNCEIRPLNIAFKDFNIMNHSINSFLSDFQKYKPCYVYETLLYKPSISKYFIHHPFKFFTVSSLSSESTKYVLCTDSPRHTCISSNCLEDNLSLFQLSFSLNKKFLKISIQPQFCYFNECVSIYYPFKIFLKTTPTEMKIYPKFESFLSYICKTVCTTDNSLKVFTISSETNTYKNALNETIFIRQLCMMSSLREEINWFSIPYYKKEALKSLNEIRLLQYINIEDVRVNYSISEHYNISSQLKSKLRPKFETDLTNHLSKSDTFVNDPLTVFSIVINENENFVNCIIENELCKQIRTDIIIPFYTLNIFSVLPKPENLLRVNHENRLLQSVCTRFEVLNYPLKSFIPLPSLKVFCTPKFDIRTYICKEIIIMNSPLKIFSVLQVSHEKCYCILQETDLQVEVSIQQLCDFVNDLNVQSFLIMQSEKPIYQLLEYTIKTDITNEYPLKIFTVYSPERLITNQLLETSLSITKNLVAIEDSLKLFTNSSCSEQIFSYTASEIYQLKNNLENCIITMDSSLEIIKLSKQEEYKYLNIITDFDDNLQVVSKTIHFVNYPIKSFSTLVLQNEKYINCSINPFRELFTYIKNSNDSINIFFLRLPKQENLLQTKSEIRLLQNCYVQFDYINHTLKIFNLSSPVSATAEIKFETELLQNISQTSCFINYALENLSTFNLKSSRYIDLHRENKIKPEICSYESRNLKHNFQEDIPQAKYESYFPQHVCVSKCTLFEEFVEMFQSSPEIKHKLALEMQEEHIDKTFFSLLYPLSLFQVSPVKIALAKICIKEDLNTYYESSVCTFDSVNLFSADQQRPKLFKLKCDIYLRDHIYVQCSLLNYPFATFANSTPKEEKIQPSLNLRLLHYINKSLLPVSDSFSIFSTLQENSLKLGQTNIYQMAFSSEIPSNYILQTFSSFPVKNKSLKNFKDKIEKCFYKLTETFVNVALKSNSLVKKIHNSKHVFISVSFVEESLQVFSPFRLTNTSKRDSSIQSMYIDKASLCKTKNACFDFVCREEKFVNESREIRPLLNVISKCDIISHGLIMFEVPYLEDKIEFISGSDLFYLCNSINHPVKCFSVSCSPSEICSKYFYSLNHEIFIEAQNPNHVIKLFSVSSLDELTSKLDYSVQHLNYIYTDCVVVNHPLTMCFVLPSPTEKHHLTMEVTMFYIYKSFFQSYQSVKVFSVPSISSEKYASYCCSQENSYNRAKSFSVPIYSQRNLTRIKNELRINRSHFCASCTIIDHHFLNLFVLPSKEIKSSHQDKTSILKYTSEESLLENNIIKIARTRAKAFDNRNFSQSIILTDNFIENKIFSIPTTRRKEFFENINKYVKTIGIYSIFDLQRINSSHERILGVNNHEIQSMTYPCLFLSRDANQQETLSEIFKRNTDVSNVLNLTSNLIGKIKHPSDSEENDLLQSLIRNSAICGNISKTTNYLVHLSGCESLRMEPKLLFNLNQWSPSVYVSSVLSRRDGLCFELLDSINLNFSELFKHRFDIQKNNSDFFNSVSFEVPTDSKTKYPNYSRSKQMSEKQYGNIDSEQLLSTFAERLKFNSADGNIYSYSLDVLKDFILTLYFTSPGSYDHVIQKFIQKTNREKISETTVSKNLDSIFYNFCSIKNKCKCKEYNVRDNLKSCETDNDNALLCNHQTKQRTFTKSRKNWIRRQNFPILHEINIINGNGNSSEQEEKFDVKIKYFDDFNERKISRSENERIHIFGRNIKSENWNGDNTTTENVNSKTSVEKIKKITNEINIKPYKVNNTLTRFHGIDFTDEEIILKLYMSDYYERIYKLYKYYSREVKNKTIIKHDPTLFSKQNIKKVQYNFDKLLYGFRNTSEILDEITSYTYLNDCKLKREGIIFERDVNKLRIMNKVDSIIDERIRHLKENILRYYYRECYRKLERNSKRVLTNENSDCSSKKTNERTRHTNAYNTFHQRFTEEKKKWEEYKSTELRRNKNTRDKYFLTHFQRYDLYSNKIPEDVILKLYLKDYIKMYETNNLSFKRKLSGKEINDFQPLIRYKPKIDKLETNSDISMQRNDIKSSRELQDFIFSELSINHLRNIEEKNNAFDAILKFYMIDYYERLNKRLKWKRDINKSSNSLFKSNPSYYKNKIESKEMCELKKIRYHNKNYNFCYNKKLSEFVVPTNLWKDDIILKYYFLSPFPFIDGTNKTRLNKAIREDNKVLKIQTAASDDDKKYENNPIKMSFIDENVYKNKTIYERILETFKTVSKHRTTRMKPKEFMFNEEFIIKTEREIEVKRSKVFQRREVNTDEDVAIIISSQKIQYFPKVLDKLTTISAIPKGFDVRKQMTVPMLTQNGNAVVDLKNKKKKMTDVNKDVSKSQFEMNFMNTKFNQTGRKKAFYTYETSV